MTFPANLSNNAQTAAIEADKWASTIYKEVQNMIDKCDAGSIGLQDIVASHLQGLIDFKARFDIEIARSGVDVAYATRYANKTFNFATDSQAFTDEVQNLIDYIVTTIPVDGVWLNTQQFADLTPGSEDYSIVQRVVTGATPLANLKIECEKVTALIDRT